VTLLRDMKTDDRGPKVIAYGRPGSGKSAFWMTLGDSCLYLDCDCGWRTGVTLKDKWSEARGSVDLRECWETDGSRATAFLKVESFVQSVLADSKAGKLKARVVVVDSFSSLCESAMRYILSVNSRLGSNPEIQHWGMMYNKVESVLINLKSLPVAVVLVCHQEIKEVDERETVEIYVPGKKLSPKVTPYFDEILYHQVKNGPGGVNQYTVKSRSTASLPIRSRCNLPPEYDVAGGAVELFKLMGYRVGVVPAETTVDKTK
jgi:hypothetical protein